MARKPIERRPKAARTQPRRWPWVVLAVVVVALVGIFVWRVTGSQPEATGTAQSGAAVPNFALPSTSGQPIALTDYHGRKLVVYFYEGST